jgi:beta-mannosidase
VLDKQLTDGWTLALSGDSVPDGIPDSVPATVPGTVHTDLLAAGLIPDPYLDLNEHEVQWIGHTDARYAVTFDFDAGDHERVDLVAGSLDTIATLRLNDREIGRTRNQHRSYRFDVRDLLASTGNRLEIDFASALDYAYEAEKRIGARPFVGNAYPYNAIRKMACNFGWDWGPVLITAGILKPIHLQAWSTARLESVRPVVTVDGSTGHVELHVAVERTAARDVTAAATIRDPEGRVVASTEATFADDSAVLSLDVAGARLWWPRGYGEQPLYELEVTLSADGEPLDGWTSTTGFRTVELEQKPDEIGTGFRFLVNGQYVFIKGANWIPDDCFLPTLTAETYARSIADATDAGMNLLRVWGGGIYESDDFYDTCDREGLLVWQDFTLACAAYSESPELWTEIEAEARENVTRLVRHPSLIVWSGGNENIEGFYNWGWKEALADGETWGDGYYSRLFPAILAELDPTRAYVPSSPYNPVIASEPRNPDNGPVHEWEVWNRQDYSYYLENVPRFVAEFGFQAPPAYSTIAKWIHDESLAADSPGISSHQKAVEGNEKLDRGLGTHLPRPNGFDDWLFATQLNQARAITFGVEHFRSHSPRTAGSIIWQLNDCWPVVSWAAVDSERRRKPLWYALRSLNAPRLLTIQPRDGGLALVASNDSQDAWLETVEVARVGFDGVPLATQSVAVDLPPHSTGTFALDASVAQPAAPDAELITATSATARRAYRYFAEDTRLAIPSLDIATAVTKTVDGYDVAITAGAFVKDLVLAVDRLDAGAEVDELFVTLLPGETATIHVATSEALDADALVRHPVLNSVNDLLSSSAENRLTSP